MTSIDRSSQQANNPYSELADSMGDLRDALVELSQLLRESLESVDHGMLENTKVELKFLMARLNRRS